MHRTVASVRTIRPRATVASAPLFKCNERAEKRKEVVPSLNFVMWNSIASCIGNGSTPEALKLCLLIMSVF